MSWRFPSPRRHRTTAPVDHVTGSNYTGTAEPANRQRQRANKKLVGITTSIARPIPTRHRWLQAARSCRGGSRIEGRGSRRGRRGQLYGERRACTREIANPPLLPKEREMTQVFMLIMTISKNP